MELTVTPLQCKCQIRSVIDHGNLMKPKPIKHQKTNKKETTIERGNPLTMKVLENTPVVLSLGKLCDENGYTYEWINGQKPNQIKNGIRIQCNTENFVPIVVPGLSTSMTPSRHERHHSTSSSSSSSSPITATSSDSETREREDQSEIDSPPVPVSSSNVDDRTVKPLFAVKPITSTPKPTKNPQKQMKRRPR